MTSLALTSVSVLDVLQTIVMLPLTLLGVVAWQLEQSLSCDGTQDVLWAVAILGVVLGFWYDWATGGLVVLGATVEMVAAALFCALPDIMPVMLDIALLQEARHHVSKSA